MNSISAFLSLHRDAILEAWLQGTIADHAGSAGRFYLQEPDRLRNPVGHAFRENLPVLFDGLAGEKSAGDLEAALDAVIRVRAVQDLWPSQAVSFLFALKDIVRRHAESVRPGPADGELAGFDRRVDRLALQAFDLFLQCRERIREAIAHEARRSTYVRERMALQDSHSQERGKPAAE